MELTKRAAAMTLMQAARSILSTRMIAIDALVLDVYAESVDHAVGHVLEYASEIFINLSIEQDEQGIDEPFEDFGEEPLSLSEAVAQVPGFVERCITLLEDKSAIQPFSCMSVRSCTFGIMLQWAREDEEAEENCGEASKDVPPTA